jgi:hypothetical protein
MGHHPEIVRLSECDEPVSEEHRLGVCRCADFNGVGFNNDGFVVCLRCGGKRQ